MASKKRTGSKSSARKKSARKASSKRGSKKSTARAAGAKRAPKRSTAARAGLKTVRQVGEKTWKTLKSTTAQVVEGVKDTFGG